jgi:hypothetical protein
MCVIGEKLFNQVELFYPAQAAKMKGYQHIGDRFNAVSFTAICQFIQKRLLEHSYASLV